MLRGSSARLSLSRDAVPLQGSDQAAGQMPLRVRPKTSCGITELSDHQADRGKSQEGKRVVITVLPVLGEPSATVEPSDGPFHDPTFGLDSKAFAASKRLYDLDCQFRHCSASTITKDRPGIGAIGKQLAQERELAKQCGQQQDAAVAILNIGAGHQRVQHQPQGVDHHVTFFALDQLTAIKARRVDRDPPFSALLTLWLSITQAVGLASRSSRSRHLT